MVKGKVRCFSAGREEIGTQWGGWKGYAVCAHGREAARGPGHILAEAGAAAAAQFLTEEQI